MWTHSTFRIVAIPNQTSSFFCHIPKQLGWVVPGDSGFQSGCSTGLGTWKEKLHPLLRDVGRQICVGFGGEHLVLEMGRELYLLAKKYTFATSASHLGLSNITWPSAGSTRFSPPHLQQTLHISHLHDLYIPSS